MRSSTWDGALSLLSTLEDESLMESITLALSYFADKIILIHDGISAVNSDNVHDRMKKKLEQLKKILPRDTEAPPPPGDSPGTSRGSSSSDISIRPPTASDAIEYPQKKI